MRDNRKVVYLQWIVIAVLVIGAGIGAYLMVHKISDLQDTNTTLSGDNDSLHNQVQQLQQAHTPSASPSAAPSASPTATPAAASPTPARTPTPTTPAKR